MEFFGTRWEDVTLETVRNFLAEASDEGIDWEAKGTELPRPERVRKTCCGLANQRGGFFLIGPRREGGDGPWVADGVSFGEREPGGGVLRARTRGGGWCGPGGGGGGGVGRARPGDVGKRRSPEW